MATTHAPLTGKHPELADIVRRNAHQLPRLIPFQERALRAIAACRTPALGGRLYACDRCGLAVALYNSCRNRHCPRCQGLKQLRWLEARKADLLPVQYFHVTFTFPEVLNPLFLHHPRVAYSLLFRAVAETLQQVARNPSRLGATLGFSLVLHTWGQTLNYHPHVHGIVTGGGLNPEKTRWIACPPGFFLPKAILCTASGPSCSGTWSTAWRPAPCPPRMGMAATAQTGQPAAVRHRHPASLRQAGAGATAPRRINSGLHRLKRQARNSHAVTIQESTMRASQSIVRGIEKSVKQVLQCVRVVEDPKVSFPGFEHQLFTRDHKGKWTLFVFDGLEALKTLNSDLSAVSEDLKDSGQALVYDVLQVSDRKAPDEEVLQTRVLVHLSKYIRVPSKLKRSRNTAWQKHEPALSLFIEKSTKLERLGLRTKFDEGGTSLSVTPKENGTHEVERGGPTEENIDAFLLTYRFFCQNNESMSLENMADRFRKLPVRGALISEFLIAREDIRRFLGQYSGHVVGGQPLSHGEILEVFMYGSLAHASNKDKRKTFETWRDNKLVLEFLRSTLIRTLAIVSKSFGVMKEMVADAMRELRGT